MNYATLLRDTVPFRVEHAEESQLAPRGPNLAIDYGITISGELAAMGTLPATAVKLERGVFEVVVVFFAKHVIELHVTPIIVAVECEALNLHVSREFGHYCRLEPGDRVEFTVNLEVKDWIAIGGDRGVKISTIWD